MGRPIITLALAALLAGCGADDPRGERATPAPAQEPAPAPAAQEEPPAPDAAIPAAAGPLAARLTDTTDRLLAAIDRWREAGDPAAGGPPREVTLYALDQQRIHLRLVRRPALARRVIPRLGGFTRVFTRESVLARRELQAIHSVVRQRPRIRVGRPQPADRLRAHYRRAWRRLDVGFPLLAAVNFVETGFNRLRNESTAGARGPMQFIPSTWAAYGLGGDIDDPRDAILGAANYLRANGAPRDEARALFHYNPSRLYVSAVRRYARLIRRDERAFYALYAWQVFLRTPGGGHRRISGPGL